MTAGAPLRNRDCYGKPVRQFDSPPRPRRWRKPAPEAWRRGDCDSCNADRKADHDGLTHVLTAHGRVGHADRERERGDHGDRKGADVSTSELAAQYQRHR